MQSMKKIKTERLLRAATLMIAGVLIGVTANLNAQSWANPTQVPTGGNAAAPINTSTTTQAKAGGFAIGKAAPAAGLLLDVNGSSVINTLGVINLVVATGTPGAGKVLSSLDSTGTVGWQTLGSAELPISTNIRLESVYIPKPCPPTVMNWHGNANEVFTSDYSTGKVHGDVGSDGNCYAARLYADRHEDESALDAFCQSIGYQSYLKGERMADFTDFDSTSDNRVIKYEPDSTSVSKFRFFPASGNNKVADDITCIRIVSVTE
jgi:hypothetical protein